MSRSASSAAPSFCSWTNRPPGSTRRRGASSGDSSGVSRRKAEGTTILLTTHYLDEAAQLSDRAGVIARGRLIDIGAIDEIGGADARVPLVRWRDASGQPRETRTTTPASVVTALVAELGGEPADLEVIRPSLEDVYLDLVRANGAEPENENDVTAKAAS